MVIPKRKLFQKSTIDKRISKKTVSTVSKKAFLLCLFTNAHIIREPVSAYTHNTKYTFLFDLPRFNPSDDIPTGEILRIIFSLQRSY